MRLCLLYELGLSLLELNFENSMEDSDYAVTFGNTAAQNVQGHIEAATVGSSPTLMTHTQCKINFTADDGAHFDPKVATVIFVR
jgi:hypothetical protein